MSTLLTLANPTAVTRTSATQTWAGLSNVLGNSGYATSTPYVPGDISYYVRCDIQAPSSPLSALPDSFALFATMYQGPNSTTTTDILDDAVYLGTTAPAGSNAANLTVLSKSPQTREYGIANDGITLAQLNAGNGKLYLGYKAYPSSYSPSDWSVTISSGATTLTASPTATLSTVFTVSVTYVGTGAAPNYADVTLVATSTAGLTAGTSTGTASVIDALGGTAGGPTIYPVPYPLVSQYTSTTTQTQRVPLIAGSGTIILTGYGTSTVLTGSSNGYVNNGLTATIISPATSTIYLQNLILFAQTTTTGGTIGGGGVGGKLGSGNFMQGGLNRVPRLQPGMKRL